MPTIAGFVGALPSMVVNGTLLALAISRWNKHPKASMYAAGGAGLLLVVEVVGRLLFVVLTRQPLDSSTAVLMATNVITGVFHTIGLGLIAAAVFADRPTDAPPTWR